MDCISCEQVTMGEADLGHEDLHAEPTLYTETVLVAIVSIVIGLGVVSNGMTIYVFHFKLPRTAFNILVAGMASYDFLSCTVTASIDLFNLLRLESNPSPLGCRLFSFAVIANLQASVTMLLWLSLLRYRGVCRPFSWNISPLSAKVIVPLSLVFAVPFAGTECLLFDVHRMQVSEERLDIDCAISEELVMTPSGKAIFSILFLTVGGIFVALAVTNGLVVRALWFRHRVHPASVEEKKKRMVWFRKEDKSETPRFPPPRTVSGTPSVAQTTAQPQAAVSERIDIFMVAGLGCSGEAGGLTSENSPQILRVLEAATSSSPTFTPSSQINTSSLTSGTIFGVEEANSAEMTSNTLSNSHGLPSNQQRQEKLINDQDSKDRVDSRRVVFEPSRSNCDSNTGKKGQHLQNLRPLHQLDAALGAGSRARQRALKRSVQMMLVILTVYTISCLPCVLIFLHGLHWIPWIPDSMAHSLTVKILLRLYYITNLANPVVYMVWNLDFRREVKGLLKKLYSR